MKKAAAWIQAHPRWTLTLATLLFLGPFLTKPYNMDDPLFIWVAAAIRVHPLNPFGIAINWYGTEEPMYVVMQNPPLASYYLAGASSLLGWQEWALHLAMLLPAIAAVLGTFRLAQRFCKRPLLAALITLFTPAFLLSGTTVMCDVLMLAFWIWAVVWWVEGIAREKFSLLCAACSFVALAALTKYYGICLVPLFALYGACCKRRFGLWIVPLFIPVLILFGYEQISHALYHRALVSSAIQYSTTAKDVLHGATALSIFTALAFLGGCMASVVFFVPWLWRPRGMVIVTGALGILVPWLFHAGTYLKVYNWFNKLEHLPLAIQIVFWSVGGILIFRLLYDEFRQNYSPEKWLLLAWILGTFVFTAVLNWTINGRCLLPMAPALAILLVRHLEQLPDKKKEKIFARNWFLLPLGLGAALALAIAQADFTFAACVKHSAFEIYKACDRGNNTVWFEGHWGFQIYMDQAGGKEVNIDAPVTKPGDFVLMPINNSNLRVLGLPGSTLFFPGPKYLTAMNPCVGAAFYSSSAGPLPFAFGDVWPERVVVYRTTP